MAKGFSFVLVTVVMVTMLVFGMLSLSGAGAGLRQAQKAASTQEAYYALDARGEKFLAACSGAAATAWQEAGAFAQRQNAVLPDDFYPGLKTAALAPGSDRTALRRGMFCYYLEKKLKTAKFDTAFTCTVDQQSLARLASDKSAAAAVVQVTSALTDASNPNAALHITLACRFGTDGVPRFAAIRWQAAVSIPPSASAGAPQLWGGR